MFNLTKKIALNLGHACNARCDFCYFHHSVRGSTKLKKVTTTQVQHALRKAKRYGVKEVEFTGGEPTIRSDLTGLIKFTKTNLNFSVVSMLTNGIALADKKYLTNLANAGLDDILFSIHGHTSAVHDRITGVSGSHDKILYAIKISKTLGIRIRTNTVVYANNYKFIPEIVKFLIEKKVDNINLIMLNPVLQAKDLDKKICLDYRSGAEVIQQAIEENIHNLPHLNIRYLPFCFLPEHTQYIVNNDQCNFDPDEWNYYLGNRLRLGTCLATCLSLLGLINLRYKAFAARFGIKGMLMAGMVRFFVLKNKIKLQQCSHCAFEHICDYIWKGYYRVFNDTGIKAIPGAKIFNPVYSTNAARIRKPGELICEAIKINH